MIWMNYPVLRVQHFKMKPQRAKSLVLSFSKHAYITATVPVTVILNLLSQENSCDSHHKRSECVNSEAVFNHNIQVTAWNASTVLDMPPLDGTVALFLNIMNSLTGKRQSSTTVKHSRLPSPPLKTATLQCFSDGGGAAADITFPGAQSV